MRLAAALPAALLAIPAAAQDATIDERIGETLPRPIEAITSEEAILTGREDIVLLARPKLFTVFLDSSVTYTTNAARSDSGLGGDVVFAIAGGARVETVIDGTWQVYAQIDVFRSDYADLDALDFAGFGAQIGVARRVGPLFGTDLVVGALYQPQFVFDGDFDDHLVSLHRLSAYVSAPLALGDGLAVAPTVIVSGFIANPSDFARVTAEFAVPVFWRPAPDWRLEARPRVYFTEYFDFFEATTGETRRDVGADLTLAATWQPNDWAVLEFALALAANDSSVDSLDFTAFDVTPTATLELRF